MTKVHGHLLVELPDNIRRVRAIVGEAKRSSSREVKAELPGSLWAAGGTYKPVVTRQHLIKAFEYILYEQGADAWMWSERDATSDGRFARSRSQKPTSPHAGAECSVGRSPKRNAAPAFPYSLSMHTRP
jgi:hypothetical protein